MLWVNDRRDLIDALDITPEFLRTTHLAEGTHTPFPSTLAHDAHCVQAR